jgi:type IV secretion system protein VirB2
MGNVLCTVVRWFTGNTGKGLATIAITIIGIGALLGKVSWGMAMIVGIGVAIVFGAAQLVNTMGAGSGSSGACASS